MIAKVYLIILAVIIVGFLAYFTTMNAPVFGVTTEHFTSDGDYESRLHVIKVFDGYLHRNPTMDEIKKYSAFTNEQDILTAVTKDFKQESYQDVSDVDIDEDSDQKDSYGETDDDVENESVDDIENNTNDNPKKESKAFKSAFTSPPEEVVEVFEDIANNNPPKTSNFVPKMRTIIKELTSMTDELEKMI